MTQWRMILAVVLSMGVFYVYSTWMAPPPKPVQPPQPPAAGQASSTPQPGIPSPVFQPDQAGIPPFKSPAVSTTPVLFENEEITARFSQDTGTLAGWSLKDFHQKPDKESPSIDLLADQGGGEAFLLTIGNPSIDQEGSYRKVEPDRENVIAVFEKSLSSLKVRKIFMSRKENPHLIDVLVEMTNEGGAEITLEPRLWISRRQKEQETGGFFSFLKGGADTFNPMWYGDGKFHAEMNWQKMPPKKEAAGKIYWSGLADRYFLLGLISRQESGTLSIQYGRQDQNVYTSLSYGSVIVRPGETVRKLYSSYLGVKKREDLQKLGSYLEKSVDYGWFGFVAIPLLWLLLFFHKIVGNWGIAIIVLTFVVKLLLHPINVKSMQSMKAMQKLQPKLQEIRQKYAGDKERLNMEMMQLFKTHKVNPMGGCLPLVIQMPVYIGLYKVLWNAIELYHAPFFWFYKDLAAPDPYMISPILLGIFMALQQKLTPQTTMDPTQQKMMMIMPIMFSAFMIFLPSGLVIYIFVNTVMSVIQQYMIHREITAWDLVKKILNK